MRHPCPLASLLSFPPIPIPACQTCGSLCSLTSSTIYHRFRKFCIDNRHSVFYVGQNEHILNYSYYTMHLRLIGKRIVDFLLVLIELFSLGLRLRPYGQK